MLTLKNYLFKNIGPGSFYPDVVGMSNQIPGCIFKVYCMYIWINCEKLLIHGFVADGVKERWQYTCHLLRGHV